MEGKARKLGGSLQVPNVQELAKDGLSELPLRYVHPEMEPALVTTDDFLPEVPVVDMARLASVELGAEELEKLRFACSEWGFFQVVEHDVSRSLIEEMKAEIGRFFGLPLEEKRRYAQEPGDLEGYGQAFVVSEEQRLDWADMFYVVTQPTSMRKPHLLPKLTAHFKDCVEAYSTELKRLAVSILGSVSKAFKMDGEEMRELFDEGMQSMRSNYYPPCPQPELAIGLTPHTDPTGLTILLQANDTEGLQVRKGGHWIPVKPFPNAFIVNIGDMLEVKIYGLINIQSQFQQLV
uniref:Fe2OG dioxygenase domain-containing protein n=1 Tax=Kalanchoe fedtschenkoi TaxID=63787 RepID=A0A7N0UPV1_KALFE